MIPASQDLKAVVYQGSIVCLIKYLMFTADIPAMDTILSAKFADGSAALCNRENSCYGILLKSPEQDQQMDRKVSHQS